MPRVGDGGGLDRDGFVVRPHFSIDSIEENKKLVPKVSATGSFLRRLDWGERVASSKEAQWSVKEEKSEVKPPFCFARERRREGKRKKEEFVFGRTEENCVVTFFFFRVGRKTTNMAAALPDPLRVYADLLLLATRADVPWSAQAVSNARRWAELAEKKRKRNSDDDVAIDAALPAALSTSLRNASSPSSCSSVSLDALLLEALAGALPLEENSNLHEVRSSSVSVERGEASARALSALAASAAAAAGARGSRCPSSSFRSFSSSSSSSASAVDDLLDSLADSLAAELDERRAIGAADVAAASAAASALHALCERDSGGGEGRPPSPLSSSSRLLLLAPPPPPHLPPPGELAAASDALAYLCDPAALQRAAVAALLLEAGKLPEWASGGSGSSSDNGDDVTADADENNAPSSPSASSESGWPAEARCLAAAHPLWARAVSRAAMSLSVVAATEGSESNDNSGAAADAVDDREKDESEKILLPSSPGPVVLRLPPALVAAAASAEAAFALGAAEVAAAVVVRKGLGGGRKSGSFPDGDGDDNNNDQANEQLTSFDAPRAAAKLLVHMLSVGKGKAARAARRSLAAAAVAGARPPNFFRR